MKKAYDDGGHSGGSIERPALQILLDDIQSGLVDIVVVYKIDRLTRSLADFAKMVEIFDAKAVSFVSVTQQFNTTTSMGRLTLNVLLSFAQFEREVTAERIRDKIAASRKKGMWMGGLPPLGYDAWAKKLVINPEEATQVRRLFEAYLELGSIRDLVAWARAEGIATKVRRKADGGIPSGGRPFSRGNLHAMLNYRAYIGEVTHRGNTYPGEQEPILPRDLWDRVQARLGATGRQSGSSGNIKQPAALIGLLFDETGDRLTPVHATKKGRRYHYYVSTRLIATASKDPSGWRLPARALEHAVIAGVVLLLGDDKQLLRAAMDTDAASSQPTSHLNQILKSAGQLVVTIQQSDTAVQLPMILPMIAGIVVGHNLLAIHVQRRGLQEILGIHTTPASRAQESGDTHLLRVPLQMKRRGVETRLIIGSGSNGNMETDINLVRAIAKAHAWFEGLKSGSFASINEIAKAESIPASEVSRQLPLAFLAPGIVDAILQGRQPVGLTAKSLLRVAEVPCDWDSQAKALGFRQI